MKFINEKRLAEIHQMFTDAFQQTRKINYIVTGDSLRAGSTVTQMYPYYREQFSKIGVEVLLNAEASMTSNEWMTDGASSSIAKFTYAVENCLGINGRDTILEYSLGVNDWSGFSTSKIVKVKDALKLSLQKFLDARPEVKIILVVPSVSGTIQRADDLLESYKQLAEEMDLLLIDGHAATVHAWPRIGTTNCLYADATHINDYGARRLVNYILNDIIPPSILWSFPIIELPGIETETALVNQAIVETGTYNSLGVDQAGANWRRLDVVNVYPRTLLKLKHKGTRRDILWKDAAGVWTLQNLPAFITGQDHWLIEVPAYAVQLKVNIETVDGAAYDLLGDVPELWNVFPVTPYVMPANKINIGLNLRMK